MKFLAAEARSQICRSVPHNRRLYFFIAVAALAIFSHSTARSNSSLSGQITGTVLDQTGASVGGAGNLLNSFDPQVLDFFTARSDRIGAGPFDSVSAIFSYNGQRDYRRSQSINNAQGLRSRISDEFNLTRAFGYQAQAVTPATAAHSSVTTSHPLAPFPPRRACTRVSTTIHSASRIRLAGAESSGFNKTV